MEHNPSYRPEIDGLRAVAVAGVLLCHFKVPGFSGGFAGVDVFFVISGFLITGMIARDINSGYFRFRDFYARRARRLFPALFVTLVVSFLAGVILFSPERLQALSTSLIAALMSVSNVLFWSQQGYFDASSSLKPLLHTWSLGVEEQFYLLWPLALVLLSRWKSATTPALTAMFVASLAANYAWRDHTSSIFYLLPFRVFEFAIGGIAVRIELYLRLKNMLRELGLAIGLAMIVVSYLIFNEATQFPSLPALLPCLGAVIVILNGNAAYGGEILRHRSTLYVGRRSYSLYLVHWPIFVFYGYAIMVPFGWKTGIWLMAASLAGAEVLYTFVEQPFRIRAGKAPLLAQKHFFRCAAGFTAILVVLSTSSISSGWAWRLGAREDIYQSLTNPAGDLVSASSYGGNGCGYTCDTNPEKPVAIYVIGDSHAQQYLAGFKASFPSINVRIYQFSSCPFFSHEFTRDFTGHAEPKLYDSGCRAERRAAFHDIKKKHAIVVVSQFWINFPLVSETTDKVLPALDDKDFWPLAADQLAILKSDLGIQELFVIGTVPGASAALPLDCAFRPVMLGLDCSKSSATRQPQLQRALNNKTLSAALHEKGITFFDPFIPLCASGACELFDGRIPIYSDDFHLTKRGSEIVINSFSGSLTEALPQLGPPD